MTQRPGITDVVYDGNKPYIVIGHKMDNNFVTVVPYQKVKTVHIKTLKKDEK